MKCVTFFDLNDSILSLHCSICETLSLILYFHNSFRIYAAIIPVCRLCCSRCSKKHAFPRVDYFCCEWHQIKSLASQQKTWSLKIFGTEMLRVHRLSAALDLRYNIRNLGCYFWLCRIESFNLISSFSWSQRHQMWPGELHVGPFIWTRGFLRWLSRCRLEPTPSRRRELILATLPRV
jgi:hypothetical protein